MKCGVVVFPASNCDRDTLHVLKEVLGLDADFIWHKDRLPRNFDLVVLPGGFSYGDYLRVGAIARFSPVMEDVCEYAEKGGLLLGICNGFQVLVEAGLLPGALMVNQDLKFHCHDVFLKVENSSTPFTKFYKHGQVLKIPIAHGDGNYFAEDETIKELEENGQIVFRYALPDGRIDAEANPNGSRSNIAGICNKKGNVLGMMPHPERCSEEVLGNTDGLGIFKSIVESIGKGMSCVT